MGNESHDFFPEEPQRGPSWQRSGWPLVGGAAEDDLTQALDPLAFKAVIKKAAAKAGTVLDEAAVEAAAGDSIRAMMLIRTYRVRGHLAADLDRSWRPYPRIPWFHRRGAGPQDLHRRSPRPRMGQRTRDRRHPARQLLRQGRPRIHAHSGRR
jgi:hypothetical protein